MFLKGNKVFFLIVATVLGVGGNVYQARDVLFNKEAVAVTGCQCNGQLNKLNEDIKKLQWRHR